MNDSFPVLYHLFNHFSKSGSGWVGGIENIYQDPCQEWMDPVNMKLTSPNYPKQYERLEHCIWNITAPKGYYISLDFELINVSGKDNDFKSSVQVPHYIISSSFLLDSGTFFRLGYSTIVVVIS